MLATDTIQRLDRLFAEHPAMHVGTVPPDQFDSVAKEFPQARNEQFRDFVLRYGGALVGPCPIYGIRPAEYMGRDDTFAQVSRRYRSGGWAGVDNWTVISSDHAGNPIGLDLEGRVWIFDHDFGGISKLCDTFDEYLQKCLKRCGY
jgi:hypothetical protein